MSEHLCWLTTRICLRVKTQEQLAELISSAFDTNSYPGDGSIVKDPDHCFECRQTNDLFVDKHWKQIAELSLSLGSSDHAFLSSEAKSFFLPAFMIRGISEANFREIALDCLENLRTLHEETTAEFSLEQCRAIVCFLDYLWETDAGITDLELWYKFNLLEYWQARCSILGD